MAPINVAKYLCVRLLASNNSRTAERIFVELDIGEIYWHLSAHCNFVQDRVERNTAVEHCTPT
jgi:hypothetical protein